VTIPSVVTGERCSTATSLGVDMDGRDAGGRRSVAVGALPRLPETSGRSRCHAALAAGRLHRAGPVSGIAMGTLVGIHVIDLAGTLAPAIEPLGSASAFKYYGSAFRDGIDRVAFVALSLVAVVLAIVTVLFEHRDVLSRAGERAAPAGRAAVSAEHQPGTPEASAGVGPA
jgi:hypothetical protein